MALPLPLTLVVLAFSVPLTRLLSLLYCCCYCCCCYLLCLLCLPLQLAPRGIWSLALQKHQYLLCLALALVTGCLVLVLVLSPPSHRSSGTKLTTLHPHYSTQWFPLHCFALLLSSLLLLLPITPRPLVVLLSLVAFFSAGYMGPS